jgi:hypothetical protein
LKKSFFAFHLWLLVFLCSIPDVHARWATREDAHIIRESYTEDTVVHKDGTYTTTYSFEDVIANEASRSYASGHTLYYTKHSSELTILNAKTILNGVEYNVPTSSIEDKPLASAPHGFDQQHQVLISFPKAEVGAKICLKYKIDYKKVATPGNFSGFSFFGTPEYGPTYWKKARMTIQSKIPLYFKVNDPEKALKVKSSKNKPIYNISVEMVKPLIRSAANEHGEINPKYKCWVSYSSFVNWAQVGAVWADEYEAIINQPLPKILRDILEEAQKKKEDVAQINEVTSLLSSKVQYMGDWQSIRGAYIPRPLKVVAETGWGDCKDFTACTASILRNMGYEVRAALINRGYSINYTADASKDDLPGFNFNHAFLRVKGKDGKIYWIDPTNFESMAQGTFSDIANKMALVLDTTKSLYERTPEVSPESSQEEIDQTLFIKDKDTVETSLKTIFRGESAGHYAGGGLRMSLQTLKERLFYAMSGVHFQSRSEERIKLPDLKSRIVKDLEFEIFHESPVGLYKSNLGFVLSLNGSGLGPLLESTSGQVGDLWVGVPYKRISRERIKNGPIPNIEKLNYAIKTPWVEVERVCKNIGNETEILTTVVFLKRYITAKELKSKTYTDLKESLLWNMDGVKLVLSKANISTNGTILSWWDRIIRKLKRGVNLKGFLG